MYTFYLLLRPTHSSSFTYFPVSLFSRRKFFESKHVGDETEETVIDQAAIYLTKLLLRIDLVVSYERDSSNEVARESVVAEGRFDQDEIFF